MAHREHVGRHRRGSRPRRSARLLHCLLGVAGLFSFIVPQVAAETVETYSGLRRTDRPAAHAPQPRVTNTNPQANAETSNRDSRSAPWRGESRSIINGSTAPTPSVVPPPPPIIVKKFEDQPKAIVPAATMPLASILPRGEMSEGTWPITDSGAVKPAGSFAVVESTERTMVRASDGAAESVAARVELAASAAHAAVKAAPKGEDKGDKVHIMNGVELSQNDVFKIAVWQVICTVCALVLGLLMLLGLALYIVRKMRHGPLFSVAFISPYGTQMGFAPMSPFATTAGGLPRGQHLYPQSMHGQPGMADADLGPMTAQKFDLGPTYEEEMALKAESEQLQQQAVLKQILDDNVRLHEQIGAETESTPV